MIKLLRKFIRRYFSKPTTILVWKLAFPVAIGMLSITAIMVADSAMVGQLGMLELAAAGVAGMAYWTLSSFVLGASYGVQILVARRFGEKQIKELQAIAASSSALFLLLGIAANGLLYLFPGNIMSFFSNDTEVVRLGEQYLYYRAMGTVPFFLSFNLRAFFDGLGKTYVGMTASFGSGAINVLLNYILIFGKFGCPAMGIQGAAVASALSSVFGFLIYLLILLNPWHRNIFFGKNFQIQSRIVLKIFSLAVAPSLTEGSQNLGFLFFMRIAGLVGALPQAVSNIMFSVLSISFMPGYAFSVAATTIVSQNIGRKKFLAATLGAKRSTLFAAMFMGVMGITFIASGESLIRLFTQDQHVIHATYWPLMIVSTAQIFDATHMVLGGALRGAGLVNWVLGLYFLTTWVIMIPLAYLLGITMAMSNAGIWLAVAIWMVVLAFFAFRKFYNGSWKKQSL